MTQAILFPGQGAQAVGMGKDLAAAMPECRALFDRAGAILGYDLASICFEGPIEKLTISAHAQPGIFVASLACWAAYRLTFPGRKFAYAAGLSSGEWTALHVAGAVGFEDALKVLEARGRLMQQACEATPGGMLSVIGAETSALERICRETDIEMANLNSREQTVLSGRKEGVDAAEKLCKELGLRKIIRLNVAGAFHSRLMRPAADQFAAVLAGIPFKAPAFPVVANVTGRPHGSPDEIRQAMVAQVYSPVRWYEGIESMKAQGVTQYLECGPGKVLSGLVKRIDKGALLHNIQQLSDLEALGAST
jgi:[acyl-carrier-protein] S-malonyltransferase